MENGVLPDLVTICIGQGEQYMAIKIVSETPGKGIFWVSPGNDLASLFSELHNLTEPEEVVRVSALRNIRFIAPDKLENYE